MKFLAVICLAFVVSIAQARVQLKLKSNDEIAYSPYYTTIRREGDFLEIYGSGTIISENHVLTSGGLVAKGIAGFLVGVGSNQLSLLSFYNVASVNIHPNFHNADKSFDLAILTLTQSLTFSDTVQPIALPPLGVNAPELNALGRIPTFGGGSVLRNTFQRVVDDDACPIYRIYPDDTSSFCATQDDLENCVHKGMGAGFIVPVSGVETIVGLASWGGDCLASTEFKYARVSSGREWIQETTGL